MSKILALAILTLFLSSCSGKDWMAKFYVTNAEESFAKALRMKSKSSFEERQKYYGKACHYFKKAFTTDSSVFTYIRLVEASDACGRSEDSKAYEEFSVLSEEYAEEHPTEYNYGYAGSLVEE
jgi:hypothetical protein